MDNTLIKTTVDIKVEVLRGDDSPVAPLVVQALQEFIKAAPATAEGKFETKAGLDVSWSVRHEPADETGRSLLVASPAAQAVRKAVTA